MANLFVDLEEDSTAKWQNYVSNTGLSVGLAHQGNFALSPNQSFHSPSSSPSSPSTPSNETPTPTKGNGTPNSNWTPPPPHQTCYWCDSNGAVIGASYIDVKSCPAGKSPDPNIQCQPDPPPTPTGNMVSCTLCDGGYPMMNMFPDECPGVWMPELPETDDKYADPCSDVDCWDCTTGGKQRVPADTPCGSSTAIRVPVTNNSSSNPCAPELGPEKDCWNCTTGVVTRLQDGEECPGNKGDALYISRILADGSSDNPCKKYSNNCYKCTDGVVESQIYQSDVEAECPTDWTQDKKPCKSEVIVPVEEEIEETELDTVQAGFLGKNTKFLVFGVVLLGVLMLMKKPPTK